MGPSLTYKALANSTKNSDKEDIDDLMANLGDIGLVCEELEFSSKNGQKTLVSKNFSVNDVYDKLEKLSNISGSGSQKKKVNIVESIIRSSSEVEVKYLVRLVLSEMRIGVGDGAVRDAVAKAYNVESDEVEIAMMAINDIEKVINVIQSGGEEALNDLGISTGNPIQPMKAKSGEIPTVIDDVGKKGVAYAEYKYDGARLQIHKDGDEVSLFTRNLEEITDSVPDVVEIIKNNVHSDNVIIDSEVVAYDEDEPMDFNQVLRRLRREEDIDEYSDKIELKIRAFDIINYEGRTLINDPYTKRRDLLEEICDNSVIGEQEKVTSAEEVTKVKSKAIQDGNEGLIVKKPDSVYKPNNRGKNWMKIKPDAETLDCVVVGGEWGEGNRAGNIGSFEVALRDGDDLKSIGKVATGITEDKLDKLTERFKDLIEREDGKDIKFTPEVVMEVGYEEIQESPDYSSGYSLRFPRFITIRETKPVSDADTVKRVRDIKS
jgi:DNA ligase-1